MTAGERALFEEMARLRFIVGNGLKLLAAGELITDGWRHALVEGEASVTCLDLLAMKIHHLIGAMSQTSTPSSIRHRQVAES